jgi:hypothetical protein
MKPDQEMRLTLELPDAPDEAPESLIILLASGVALKVAVLRA